MALFSLETYSTLGALSSMVKNRSLRANRTQFDAYCVTSIMRLCLQQCDWLKYNNDCPYNNAQTHKWHLIETLLISLFVHVKK
jgi:hypothetical protein